MDVGKAGLVIILHRNLHSVSLTYSVCFLKLGVWLYILCTPYSWPESNMSDCRRSNIEGIALRDMDEITTQSVLQFVQVRRAFSNWIVLSVNVCGLLQVSKGFQEPSIF